MRNSILGCLLLLLLGGLAFGQSLQPAVVSVVGEAELSIAPDQVVFTFEVITTAKDVASAKRANDLAVARTLSVTKAFQIDPVDVKTESLTISPKYTSAKDPRGEHVLAGYDVTKQILITLKDLAKIDDFLGRAIEAGVNRVVCAEIGNSQQSKYEDEARTMAVENARIKAQAYAQKLGQTIGKATVIREEGADYPAMATVSGNGDGNGMADAHIARLENPSLLDPMGKITFALGQITVQQTIYVIFELK